MIRRQFIKLAAFTATSAIAPMAAPKEIKETEEKDMECTSVTWKVSGFTCLTCAAGLKVMLRAQKGVAVADASYEDASVTVDFDPQVVTESTLRSYITSLGFTLGEEKG